jgi:hypothetical protein
MKTLHVIVHAPTLHQPWTTNKRRYSMSSKQAQARHTAADAHKIFEIERELSDYRRKHLGNRSIEPKFSESVAGAAGTEDGERAKDKIAKAAAVEAGMKGDTPLPDKIGKAVETGNLTAVLKYLRKGGDVNATWTAKFNRTMLHEAACSRNPQMVSALLQYRADPNTQCKGAHPAQLSAERRQIPALVISSPSLCVAGSGARHNGADHGGQPGRSCHREAAPRRRRRPDDRHARWHHGGPRGGAHESHRVRQAAAAARAAQPGIVGIGSIAARD